MAPTPVTRLRGDRFLLDLRYNTPDNFLGRNVYREFGLKECFVLRRVKQGVLRIVPELRKRKLKLVLLDCWRPIEVQRKMWELVPIPGYVADPAKGSNHNRGVALDVTLARENGKRLAMPTKFDDFTPKAHRDYRCAPQEKEKCANRKLLEGLMRKAGLRGLSTEWWHFQLPEAFEEAEQFPILDQVSGPRGQ